MVMVMTVRTVFCVQPYRGRFGRLEPLRMQQFASASEALAAGRALTERASGVLVFRVEGEPDFGEWAAPEVLARHGELPDCCVDEKAGQ
jgi:hypothetical protein